MYADSKERKKQYRKIFECLCRNPRIQHKPISKALRVRVDTVGKRMKEAFERGYIVGPQMRKRSYSNFREFMYFVDCKDPLESYEKLIRNKNVIYHAIMDGFANLWVISNKEVDVYGDIIVCGVRSDFHISSPPEHSWNEAIEVIQEMITDFDLKKYTPKTIIETHWNETIEWDDRDEILLMEFKHDLRKSFKPVLRENHIGFKKLYKWLAKLPECCTVYTCYYPETIAAYDPYIFKVKTDCEDFIIELFSQLPTTTYFFKVSNYLFIHTWVERRSMINARSPISEVVTLQIPLLLRDLEKKGAVKEKEYAVVRCYWREDSEDFYPG